MGGRRGKRAAPTDSPAADAVPSTHIKKQKRDEYKAVTGDASSILPKKKWFRQRAHANPFSDHQLTYPTSPDTMDWSSYYPAFLAPTEAEVEGWQEQAGGNILSPLTKYIEVADIGCGFGGLLFALAPLMPNTLLLGLEIRTSVTEFVQSKIRALRHQQANLNSSDAASTLIPSIPTDEAEEDEPTTKPQPDPPTSKDTAASPTPIPGAYSNIAALRANTMKFLPNFFPKASLSKIFLCFPDPHFKARKHKARIVSSTLTSEYAYVLRPGGMVYTITDVEDLGRWMRERFAGSKQFEEVQEEERERDECVRTMRYRTEEGLKVDRNGGLKIVSVWRRVVDPPWPGEEAVT